MGSVIKIGKDYYIEFVARGLTYRRNGGRDPNEARRLLDSIEAKIEKGEMDLTAPEIAAQDFFGQYRQYARGRWPAKSRLRFEWAARHFCQFLTEALPEGVMLQDVTPGVVEEYRSRLARSQDSRGRPLKPGVINLTLVLLKEIFQYAITVGYLNDNPALHARMADVSRQTTPKVLKDREFKRFLSGAEERMKSMITVLVKSGITVDELTDLTWVKVDFKENYLKIESPGRDGGKRQVPMDGELAALLEQVHRNGPGESEHVFAGSDGRPLTREQVLGELERAARTIDLNAVQLLRALRNTFAAYVLKKGVTLPALAKLAGFNDVAKVMRYQGLMQQEK